ncbi:nucleotide exchange factor GrpE [Paenibacillus apiarius]|uniref:Protein GrpE n=1 Tax=Paenibacillus apiarius TaxID=46240 RepID=A0ABT4DPK2_9BACL|nr:nucleotide exchange factor GrpE [Paenibacillus apiarius]MCY9513502.1 nucleotide exchange factor GrpE [Paenibacillus apiarius]MCY9518053.1 nucleotide exchange factor GrpE [Paenibacillus apiarius]MCY9551546.1 nucleotide exchange factor GrpE [Paenibacillus apiarius]MCY9558700.1 nucleotide exchange factor GrpE [Paenibacillus apiarius]MCY9683986.1 nucleotide exchange factor GrpE [Paenibacillus apiarius]
MNPEQEEMKVTEEDMQATAVHDEHSNEADNDASASEACSGTQTAGEGNRADESNPLHTELQQAKEQAEEHYQRYLRTQADFDNFRRRTMKEKEDLAKYASAKVVTELLPVLDNFERALATGQEASETDSFVKGVDMIFRQIQQVMEQEGVQPMNAVGEPFNPEYHQAIMQVESDEYEEGIVVEEVQKGYMLKDKVLRPAMVKVSG